MLSTLYGKLALTLLILFFLIGSLYIFLTLFTTQMYLQEVNQKFNRKLARHLVADNVLMKEGQVNQEILEKIFHMLMVINPNIEIYLLDSRGTILAFSAQPEKIKRSSISLEPVRKFLNETDSFPILGDDPRDASRKKIFSVAPIPVNGETEGYLYIILGGEEYDSVVEILEGSYILRLSVWAALAGMLFALLAGLVLFNILTRRVRKLAFTMEDFAKSDFTGQVYVAPSIEASSQGSDEIDRLELTFNCMAQLIYEQVMKLKKTDLLRRELVANVSHDLRTPLASLHGYLETLLLKEGKLTVEEQRKFLNGAIKQSDRLGQLMDELFELAKLDSHEVQIRGEPFSLGELVQDVTQKFQLAAEHKQVKLQVRFGANLPLVSAEIGLIERALENIIQNALRYTPSGGMITVGLIHEGNKVTVEIADTGCGIPKEDLPYIFDRFYRVDKHRRAEGSGLGLAITKRILELHGSTIEAQSTFEAGTIISFQLPAV